MHSKLIPIHYEHAFIACEVVSHMIYLHTYNTPYTKQVKPCDELKKYYSGTASPLVQYTIMRPTGTAST